MAIAALTAEVAPENLDVWFQDEARIGQQGSLTRIWAIKGSRPRVVRQQQFEHAFIFGAVCPQRDDAVAIIMPEVNNETMSMHLQEISNRTALGRHAIVVMDRAGWHIANALQKFNNLTILFLPPYSPELNPVEQVWQWLRDKFLANRCFQNYDDILNSSALAWQSFVAVKETVRNLCSRQWANL